MCNQHADVRRYVSLNRIASVSSIRRLKACLNSEVYGIRPAAIRCDFGACNYPLSQKLVYFKMRIPNICNLRNTYMIF